MGSIYAKIPDDLDDEFRRAVSAKHKNIIKKGDVTKAILEALTEWTEKNKPQEK